MASGNILTLYRPTIIGGILPGKIAIPDGKYPLKWVDKYASIS
jgi:hypothetical protein